MPGLSELLNSIPAFLDFLRLQGAIPAVASSVVLYILLSGKLDLMEKKSGKKFDEVGRKFDEVGRKFDEVGKRFNCLEKAIVEIQTILRTKWNLCVEQPLSVDFGQVHSPIVLKDEFLPFIVDSGLKKQIDEKLEPLVEWLKSQSPKTGLDAQSQIIDFVVSEKISDYLDLTVYKQYLYQKGKSSRDAYGMLAVYLYGVLIPRVFPKVA